MATYRTRTAPDVNVAFCRTYLAMVLADVREHTTADQRKAVWVWCMDRKRGDWEFHGPDGYYWDGRADNAYDARAKGWAAWMREQGHEE